MSKLCVEFNSEMGIAIDEKRIESLVEGSIIIVNGIELTLHQKMTIGMSLMLLAAELEHGRVSDDNNSVDDAVKVIKKYILGIGEVATLIYNEHIH